MFHNAGDLKVVSQQAHHVTYAFALRLGVNVVHNNFRGDGFGSKEAACPIGQPAAYGIKARRIDSVDHLETAALRIHHRQYGRHGFHAFGLGKLRPVCQRHRRTVECKDVRRVRRLNQDVRAYTLNAPACFTGGARGEAHHNENERHFQRDRKNTYGCTHWTGFQASEDDLAIHGELELDAGPSSMTRAPLGRSSRKAVSGNCSFSVVF